ncbi:aryl-alcohol dehydrogenase-like predicted oxidoreductase [Algoriphagus iocasae]|jgi:aryl-alcohol dehydrogenase-like predicted oxidoreductase|uniref:Aryl-alcohol dehydrogenase-like predicted oxidoreductase n=1 Tax=Algoriphagus iocasae TaxID=1836499 RepID=A0A841MRE8_9BACT|nr:aldo/keto reductase [Algoriphagus iocasae]MBB6328209.1 aryl-alcohol dehydrogenase-like predicted oxidoreductase [Algoriphagus iocasae]
MKYNYVGNTGLLVSELCFGTMTFGGQDAGMWDNIGKLQQKEVNEMLTAVVDSGINFIDTANVYSYGQSEQLLGQALKDLSIKRDEIIIATKVLARMNDKPNSTGLSRYHIFNSVEASLQRLQLDYIDILYVHGVDPATSLEEIVRSLNDIVESGKVRYISICNWPAWMVAKAQTIAEYRGYHKFIGLQYYYAAVSRDIEHELVPMAKNHDLAIFPWSPLAGGFLTGKFTREEADEGSRRANFDFPPIDKEKAYDLVDVMGEIAKVHDASIAQVALAWVRQQPGITSTIIGAKTLDQLKANIESTNLNLTQGDLSKIDAISPLPKQYPGWMVERQSNYRK